MKLFFVTEFVHDIYKCYKGDTEADISIKEESLYAHNQLRAKHRVLNLIWSKALVKKAQVSYVLSTLNIQCRLHIRFNFHLFNFETEHYFV